jgi:hypothetical protein
MEGLTRQRHSHGEEARMRQAEVPGAARNLFRIKEKPATAQ